MKLSLIGLFIGLALGINNLIGLTSGQGGYYLGLGPIVDAISLRIGETGLLLVIIIPAIFYTGIGYLISKYIK